MSRSLLLFLTGRTLLVLGLLQLLPLLAALWGADAGAEAFGFSAGIILVLGGLFSFLGREHLWYMNVREGAAFMLLVWLSLALGGMLPYLFMDEVPLADAIFESVSGLTTTGATCITASLPPSVHLWHAMMQWMGGLNVLILLATVLPQVSGCFGISLILRQGSSSSRRLHWIGHDALQVARVYLLFTLAVLALYFVCGLDGFGSLNLALVTMSTGGGYDMAALQHNGALQIVTILCILFVSGNFLLYCCLGHTGRLRKLRDEHEFKVYLGMIFFFGCLVAWHLWRLDVYDLGESLRMGFFHVLSFSSTTGLVAADIAAWPDFDRYVLFALVFVGGCIGSPTGGIRVLRLMILFKSAFVGMRRTLHPHMVASIQINGLPVPVKILGRILNFFFLYMGVFFLFSMLISLSGITALEAMGVSAACLSSVGSTSMLGGNMNVFVSLPDWAKLACSFLMILGRLEIFSFLIVLQSGIHDLQRKW